MRFLLPLILVLPLVGGCAPKPADMPTPVAAPTSAEAAAAAKTEAEALWAERGDPAKLEASLGKYEQVVAGNPSDRDALMHLVRGWYFRGDGHETDTALKLAHWEKAIAWGNKCLTLNTEYAALLQKGDEDPSTAARALKAEDVPCTYWLSSALGKWAKASGLTVTLKHLPTVKAYMTRVQELEPAFYYNGPDRYWGAYYAGIPSFAGQDLNKSNEYFQKSLAAWPNVLGIHVLYAEAWATKTQNKEIFKKELEWVLAQPADLVPEIKPEAEAEQRKAKALLAEIDNLFAN